MYWSMGANNVLTAMYTYPASLTATGWAAVSLVDSDYTFGLPPKVAVVGALKYDGSGAEAAVVALRGRGTGHGVSQLESELDGMLVKVYFHRQMPTPVMASTYVPMVWTAGMLPVTVPTLKARPWPGMGRFQPVVMGPQMMAPYQPRGFPGGMMPAPEQVVVPVPAPVMAPVGGPPMATPNPDCLIDYNGGPMQFRSCRTLAGDIGMRLLWQTNPANDTLIMLFTAVTPGWAAFSFSGADQLMLGNPNKLAVIGVTTEDGETTARVYSIAARTPAGVQPAEDAAIMGAYDNVSAERDGELIKVYFERPLSAVPGIGGPMTNAIWSIGEVAPSLTNLPGHTLAEAGIVNLFGVRVTPMPSPAANGDDIGEAASGVADAVAACFPADATATLASGARVRMDELAIGDTVAVGGGRFSDVFAFTHADAAAVSTFVELTVAPIEDTCSAHARALRLTPGHYLSVNGRLAAAGTVVVGDVLVRADGSTGVVTAVATRPGRGLYNPQTLHGDILVDGVVASTYTTAVEPRLAAAALAPLRAAYALGGGWLGTLLTGSSRLAGVLPGGPAVVY